MTKTTFASRMGNPGMFVREAVEFFCSMMLPFDRGSHTNELLNLLTDTVIGSPEELVGLLEKSLLTTQSIRGEKKAISKWFDGGAFILQYSKNEVCYRLRIHFGKPGLRKRVVFVVMADTADKVRFATRNHLGFDEPKAWEKAVVLKPQVNKTERLIEQKEVQNPIPVCQLSQILEVFDKVTVGELFRFFAAKR